MESSFRQLPSVDSLISHPRLVSLGYPHDWLVGMVREELEGARVAIAAGQEPPSSSQIIDSLLARISAFESAALRPVINATGVILHTNLGRAPLSAEAIAAMESVSRGYCNLEFDLDSGARGSRHTYIGQLLCQLTGAEAALVVNNNAAAVLLGLTVLARRKEVIVSRSQAVEIGGGFRIPDVMRQSGAKLVEVGTTNCTYIADYEQAVAPRTAALMRVHSSNFKIMGYTHEASIEELGEAGKRLGIAVFDDLGSGCLLDTAAFGLAPEPTVQRSLAAGVDLICFSADKLLGGPQAGIILGKQELIKTLGKHPLVRAMRIDKTRLAALAVTLEHHIKGEATAKIPVWRMISAPLPGIEERAGRWAAALGERARVSSGETMIGGGSLPGGTLPTWLVALKGGRKERDLAPRAARWLRLYNPPVIGRISGDTLLLDPRSVLPEEDETVVKALRGLTLSLVKRG